MPKPLLTYASLIIALFYTAAADAKLMPASCGMTETATMSISFNGIENDINLIKSKFDGKIREIEQIGKEMTLEKFELQSMSYNINPQNYNGGTPQYQFNGSVSFAVLPAAKATDLMVALTKKGYQASVNVNSYRSGNMCPNISNSSQE